jgi:cytochrome c5
VVALCKDCHQSQILGWHGQRRAWAVRKMDELDALAKTIERLL